MLIILSILINLQIDLFLYSLVRHFSSAHCPIAIATSRTDTREPAPTSTTPKSAAPAASSPSTVRS